MVTYTSNKNLQDPAAGSLNWDSPLNSNFNVIDQAFGSTYPILVSNGGGSPTVALTSSTAAINSINWYDAQQLTIQSGTVVGTPTALTGNVTINLPNSIGTGTLGGAWIVSNNISAANQGAYTVKISGNNGSGAGVYLASGKTALIWTDGTNVNFAQTNVDPIAVTSVSSAASLNTAIFNTTIVVSGSSYTLTVPTPSGNNGATFQVYLASGSSTVTFSTPAGTFSGPSGSAAATMALSSYNNNYIYTFVSNGSAWYVFQSPVSSNQYGRVSPRSDVQTNQSSPWSWNSDTNDQYSITALANALTINADAGSPVNGQKIIFRIQDNGTARALTWTTGSAKSFQTIGVTLPTTTTVNKITYVGCIFNSNANRWDAVAVNLQA